jgi:hypothetical protein
MYTFVLLCTSCIHKQLQAGVSAAVVAELAVDLAVVEAVLEDAGAELVQLHDDVVVSERTSMEVR